MKKLVSVIVPTKNSASTLGDCLLSLTKQTYESVEIIVVDNFSTDSSLEIAGRYTSDIFKIGPERSAQRNFGVDQAHGEYVAIIDSDMYLDSGVISDCVKQIEQSSDIVGVVIPEQSFGEGFWAQCKRLERSFYVGVPYMEAARFFRRMIFKEAGGYDVAMISGEDWDLSERVSKLGMLTRIQTFIHHNEGHISLITTIRKKYYYAQKFAQYTAKHQGLRNTGDQVSLIKRYWLFLSHPRKLMRNPALGVGVLFMKTCEFGFGGLGYAVAMLHHKFHRTS
jgi:glycosyltransferase involved in cell wall biosynthesis